MARKSSIMKPIQIELTTHDSITDLTAPLNASVTLTNYFLYVKAHADLLEKQTRIIRNDTTGAIDSIIEHPQLIKWATLEFKVLAEILKLNMALETTTTKNKIDAVSVVLDNLDKFPLELREAIIKNLTKVEQMKDI